MLKNKLLFSYENPKYVTSQIAIKNVEGKILGLIDILSQAEEQKNALKAAVRQYLWGLEKVMITNERFDGLKGMSITYSPAENIMSSKELGQE